MSLSSASLSSSAFFTPALFNIQNASNSLATSTARLSSGNRIVNVGDDVASFSIAASLQSQLSSLQQASSNAAQGNSLLQVASGGLQQIAQLLDSMASLAQQANNASLTAADRGFLQQQFAQDLSTVDTIAGDTSFNGIGLLNGELSSVGQALTQTSTATQASGSIIFTGNPATGNTVKLNGVTLTADTEFAVGGNVAATTANLLAYLQSSTNTALSQATYTANGANGITITAKAGGTLGGQYYIDQAGSTAPFTTSGDTTNAANVYTLSGGLDNGLNIGSTTATGTPGDTLVGTQSQNPGSVTLAVTGAIANNETLQLDDGNGGLITFTFKAAAAGATEIQIGASTEETLQNAVKTISDYSAANAAGDNYGLRQLSFAVSGSNLVISSRTPGNPTDLTGAVLDVAEGMANASFSAATISNGTNTGINASHVTNQDFTGEISGFSATYVGADSLTASVTVGGSTYTGAVTDTTPAGNTTVRFSSTSGGYFDVQLAGGQGSAVTDQSDADAYATRLDAAFNGITFYQSRSVTNFSGTNSLVGASAKLQLSDFSGNPSISSIKVTAPSAPGGDATIDLTIDGATFRASTGLGGTIGAGESVKFVNTGDSNQFVTLTNGSTAQDFSTDNAAATFQSTLRTDFGVGTSGSSAGFRVGPSPDDVISVTIGSATADTIFNGTTPDLSSVANAAAAETAVAAASDVVQGMIAGVGALQSSFNATSDNLSQSILGITAAHSALADTDIAAESTQFALDALKVNTGVAVLAQALSLQPRLLGLLAPKS